MTENEIRAALAPWETARVTIIDEGDRRVLVRRGFALEWVTLGWNVAGIIVVAIAVAAARSVALAGFGLDSLIEIGASTVVIWELSTSSSSRRRRSPSATTRGIRCSASSGPR